MLVEEQKHKAKSILKIKKNLQLIYIFNNVLKVTR